MSSAIDESCEDEGSEAEVLALIITINELRASKKERKHEF